MAIKETEVEVRLSGSNMKYYENLGYNLPRKLNKYGKITVPRGTKIIVKIQDLISNSTAKVTKICDICGRVAGRTSYFHRVLAHRKGSGGLDTCRACGTKKKHANYIKRNDCLAETHPHISNMLINKEDAHTHTPHSNKEVAFRCNECNHVFNKAIQLVTQTLSVLFCPRCSDGIKYPEKFVRSLLMQLGEDHVRQKLFKGWFYSEDGKNIKKYYDFYIKRINCIIEVHGEQHFVETFKRLGGRTLNEEQENDRQKKEKALEEGIHENNYIVIDAKISSLEYLKDSILNSRFIDFFDLSKVDWDKCHEDALKTIVKTACDEWNNGMKSTKEISIKLGLGQKTVIKYLKQGAEIGWCDYNAENEIYSRKAVVQLSSDGKYINNFSSASEARREMGLRASSSISSACRGVYKQIGGFRWMFKEEYDNLTEEARVSLSKLESPPNQKKEIFQLDEDLNIIKTFESFTEAKRQTGVTSIWEACNGKIKTAGGYKWRIKEDYENLTEEEKVSLRTINVIPPTRKKEVYQLDENYNLISVFESSAEARRQTGVRKIGEVCNGNRKFAGGYKWMFKEDYLKGQLKKFC